jgi:hypothetical protein
LRRVAVDLSVRDDLTLFRLEVGGSGSSLDISRLTASLDCVDLSLRDYLTFFRLEVDGSGSSLNISALVMVRLRTPSSRILTRKMLADVERGRGALPHKSRSVVQVLDMIEVVLAHLAVVPVSIEFSHLERDMRVDPIYVSTTSI